MSRSRVVNLANFDQFTAINLLSDPGHKPGPVVVPNAVKVMLVWTLSDAKTARNVLGGIIGSFTTATPTVAEQIRAALVAHASFTALMTHIAPSCSFARVEIQDIRAAGLPVVASTGAAVPGTSAGIALPDEVALVLTLRTALVGAQNRGRMFQPGWASSELGAGGVATAAAVLALQNFTGAINTGMAAGGLSWGLIKPERVAYTGSTGTAHPARVASIAQVTQTNVRDNHWDSQRRRGLR